MAIDQQIIQFKKNRVEITIPPVTILLRLTEELLTQVL